MKRLSVRLRVTIWITLLMLVLSASVTALLLYAGKQAVVSSTKNDLMKTVEESRSDIEYEYGVLDFDDDIQYFNNGVSLSVYNARKQLLYGRSPEGFPHGTVFESGTVRTVGDARVEWYVYDMLYHQEGYGGLWLRGVLPAHGSDTAFAKLLYLSLLLLPLLVVLTALGGYWVTKFAFLPVRKIAETANEIADDGKLSRRIALGGGSDEIYTLAATFDRMFDRLEQGFEKERRFTADASHELRTPVSVIVSECEYALSSAQTPNEVRESFESIFTQAKRMSELIAHLLKFARADQHRIPVPKEPVNVGTLAMGAAEQVTELAEAKNILVKTEISDGLYINGDEALLAQLLWNLAENAVKYGKENGYLRISLSSDGEKVMGVIEDDGIGMAAEHIDKIWERFYRVDGSRSTRGFGLGLAMCKYIVAAHGGEISVESELGRGSKFIFSLPKK
jgi:signal transduction histidine kinase